MGKCLYSVDTREKMITFMFTNKKPITRTGQNIIKSPNVFYTMMTVFRLRKPYPLVSIRKIIEGRTYHNEYSLTLAGEDYAKKIMNLRELERRE